MRETDTGRFVGQVGFTDYRRDITPALGDAPECGWVLASWGHGRGYAGEAVGTILAWADEALDADRSVCFIEQGHVASIRVARRVGYTDYAPGEYKGVTVTLFERSAARRSTGTDPG